MTLLSLGLKWIRANWRLCATLAFACAVIASLLYARAKWIEQGREEERARFDLIIRKGREEMVRRDLRNAAAQAKAFADGQAIGERRVRDQVEIIAERDRTIAGLRAGTVRLRQQFQACVPKPEAGATTASAGGSDAATERGEAAPLDLAGAVGQSIFIGDDYDSRVKRLQEVVLSQQDFMLQVCPVTLSSP